MYTQRKWGTANGLLDSFFLCLLWVSNITIYLEVVFSNIRVIQRYILYWNRISIKIIQKHIFLSSIQFILISKESGYVWLHNFAVQYIGYFEYFFNFLLVEVYRMLLFYLHVFHSNFDFEIYLSLKKQQTLKTLKKWILGHN